MAIGDPYCTLAELKNYLGGQQLSLATSEDEALTDAIASASEEIERACKRQFNRADTPTARVFPPLNQRVAYVDEFWTTDGLVVEVDMSGFGDWQTLNYPGDYQLYPLNGVVDGQPGWPFRKIAVLGGRYFPIYTSFFGAGASPYGSEAIVRVTAHWGWEHVPAPVHQACLILAAANYKLKDAPLGVAGTNQFGLVRVQDNKFASAKLAKYLRQANKVGG